MHPDGSRNGPRLGGGGRGADSDELLNDNEEKLEALRTALYRSPLASPSRVVRRRRPQVTALPAGATAYSCNYASVAVVASRRVENEVGGRASLASKRLPDLIRSEVPTLVNSLGARGLCGSVIAATYCRRTAL